jgi:hypothetical protein
MFGRGKRVEGGAGWGAIIVGGGGGGQGVRESMG